MANRDIFVHFSFFRFAKQSKNEKREHICGYFLFFDFSAFNQKRKNRKLRSSPLKFLFFYVWQKMEKSQLCLLFVTFSISLANWRDVMDLVKYLLFPFLKKIKKLNWPDRARTGLARLISLNLCSLYLKWISERGIFS